MSENSDTVATNTEITPDLIRQVTEKVYDLWRKDLRIANERKRLSQRRNHNHNSR